MTTRIALLTSCTMSRNYDPVVKIEDAPICNTMDDLCSWWVEEIQSKTKKDLLKTPGELYAGIAFDTITEIAQAIGHDNIFVVTGGIGLTGLTQKILPYDFTSDKNAPSNAHQHVTGEKFIPHLWWAKINDTLNGTPTPIADLIDNYDIIIGALPKAFIKYTVRDLEAVSPREVLQNKLFFLLPRSMTGGVAKTIHGALVPYGASYAEGLSANRYDKAQRVALKFLNNYGDDPVAYAQSITEQAGADAMEGNDAVDYEQMFTDHPRILEGNDIGLAIHRAKALGLKIGGKHRFAGAWRGAKGQVQLVVSATVLNKAKKGLKAILDAGTVGTYADNAQLLERLALFVQAVREESPSMIFTSKEVTAWGKVMYEEDTELHSAAKVSYVLSYHTKYLGLEMLSAGSTNAYRIMQ